MKHLSFIICCWFAVGCAHADCEAMRQNGIELELARALAGSGGVTVDIREAQSAAYTKYDRELNRVYRTILQKLPARDKPAFVEAQRAWLRFSEMETKFLWTDSMFGNAGTSGPVAVSDTMREVLRRRVCNLQNTLEYLEHVR